MIKNLRLPKIIGSILSVKASPNVDVSNDLANNTVPTKTIAELLNEEKENTEEKTQKHI